MPPRSRKAYGIEHHQEDVNLNETCKQSSQNKENICLRLRNRKKKDEDDNLKLKIKQEDSDDEFEKMLLSFEKQKVYSKPLSFWGKKIKDLESQNNTKKKCKLYEFSGSDDSASLYKTEMKKPKRKCGIQKKKPNAGSNVIKLSKKEPKSKIKAKENHKQSFLREQVILSGEREKPGDEKLRLSTELPFFAVTSTPAVPKVNLVSASNFMFLSPVIKETDECCIMNNGKCRLDSKIILDSENKTPKRETNLRDVNVRVLRSKKVTKLK